MMSTTAFISVVVGVIIASGLLGGVLNYYLTRKADPDDTYVGKSLLLGVGAALLVHYSCIPSRASSCKTFKRKKILKRFWFSQVSVS